jgi:hypothetical protein
VAHNSDAVTDVLLYTSGERRDEAVLINLYGLTAAQILLGWCGAGIATTETSRIPAAA